MKYLLVRISMFGFITCQGRHEEIFTFNKQIKPIQKEIVLEKRYSMQAMEILNNTLNDTCKIGIMNIPPGTVGKLYNIEFYDSVLKYTYNPYKATEGSLTIKHIFY